MGAQTSQTLAAALEEVIWSVSAEELVSAEGVARALLAGAGCDLASLLAELPDETLVLAIQKTFLAKPAFEELLVNRHEQALRRWFTLQLGSIDCAEELIQELYLKLWAGRALATYDAGRPFRAWLWTVAHNLCVGEFRRQRNLSGLPETEQSSPGPSPLEEVAYRELEQRVESAVRELPDVQQQVLRGAMGGHSADDMARQLKLPKHQVYRLLFRARRHVERSLEPDRHGTTRCKDAPADARVPLEGEVPS